MNKKFEYDDWVLFVDEITSTVKVIKDGESRIYDLKDKIIKAEQDEDLPMYVDVHVEGGKYYSFKFEDETALIGDIYDENEEHVEPFAAHYFGEEFE